MYLSNDSIVRVTRVLVGQYLEFNFSFGKTSFYVHEDTYLCQEHRNQFPAWNAFLFILLPDRDWMKCYLTVAKGKQEKKGDV